MSPGLAGGGYSCWWRKRILTVIVPYALVEIICYWPFHEFSVIGFVLDVFCIKPKYPYGWYLQYLVLWYVLFYVVMRVSDRIHLDGEKKILVFSLISIILFFTQNEIRAEQSLSFLTGIILSEKKEKVGKILKWRSGFLLTICGIAFLALKQLDFIRSAPQLVYNLVQLGIKLPVGMGLIILCYLIAEKINLRLFAWVGMISYELYLIHGYVLPNVKGIVGAVLFWLLSFGIGALYHLVMKKLSHGIKVIRRMESTR